MANSVIISNRKKLELISKQYLIRSILKKYLNGESEVAVAWGFQVQLSDLPFQLN